MLSHNEIRLLISALGTGIGPEEFDVAKLRYHKVILMTDADVDGAHIRTLLLTFFFRHMVQVIEAGNLFIAQPPLFKVKKGKAERYLMSEREMEEFLLEHLGGEGERQGGGEVGAHSRSRRCWRRSSGRWSSARSSASSARRGIPGPIIDGLLRRKFRGTKRGVGDTEIVAAVREVVGELAGWELRAAGGENGDASVLHIGGPQPAVFSPDLLKSPDYAQLLEAHAEIAALHKGPCTVIDAAGKETEVKALDELLRVVMGQAKDGATLQRYKGLGEMNPEQLWETTMNPETRTLLKVTMEDAVGADEIFTVLMGDAVEPRRDFIEKNALDVVQPGRLGGTSFEESHVPRTSDAGSHRRGDAEVVSRLRDVRHRRARAPRHPRWAQARAPARAPHHEPDRRLVESRATRSRPGSSATAWGSSTRTVTRPSTRRSSGWSRSSPFAIPLVDGQGNFGSIDGDPAAAMRYTESRMAKIAHEMIADIEKDTVDFVPNYDENEQEPVVLPTRIPNLLVNGSSGIAVGMATNIPPHNLTEVVDGLTMLIDNPETSIEGLMKVIPGPDFPTAGYIYGRNGIT